MRPTSRTGSGPEDPVHRASAARFSGMIYTGSSDFLQANRYFLSSLVTAADRCEIHALEDIYDTSGLKLWARGRPIDSRLLERLSDRTLRKPIELCVYAADPVASASIAQQLEELLGSVPDLAALLSPCWSQVSEALSSAVPTPTELLLISVLRHGDRDLLRHAAVVAGLSIAAVVRKGLGPQVQATVGRAALLHDVGFLYLDPAIAGAGPQVALEQARLQRSHPLLGAQVCTELAHTTPAISRLVATSHERLDGSGFPAGLSRQDLTDSSLALAFAEDCTRYLGVTPNGLQRAATRLRMLSHEFPEELMDWVLGLARELPLVEDPDATSPGIEWELRRQHALIARLIVLFSLPVGEAAPVREEGSRWLASAASLRAVLYRTGAEAAFSQGISIAPESRQEAIELAALRDELHWRIGELHQRIEVARADRREFAASPMVNSALEILREHRAEKVPMEATP